VSDLISFFSDARTLRAWRYDVPFSLAEQQPSNNQNYRSEKPLHLLPLSPFPTLGTIRSENATFTGGVCVGRLPANKAGRESAFLDLDHLWPL
jgi:hypothetical protein